MPLPQTGERGLTALWQNWKGVGRKEGRPLPTLLQHLPGAGLPLLARKKEELTAPPCTSSTLWAAFWAPSAIPSPPADQNPFSGGWTHARWRALVLTLTQPCTGRVTCVSHLHWENLFPQLQNGMMTPMFQSCEQVQGGQWESAF